jgi:hypothetical protein
MATRKSGSNKKAVLLSDHVQQVAAAVQVGVSNALKKDPCDTSGVQQIASLGQPVNPKTVSITVTWVIDLS